MPAGDLYRFKAAFCWRRPGSPLSSESYCLENGGILSIEAFTYATLGALLVQESGTKFVRDAMQSAEFAKANDFRLFAQITAQAAVGRNKVVDVLKSNESNLLRLVG